MRRAGKKTTKEISNFIAQHLTMFGTMPGKCLIADATGLSRGTVNKHLRHYAEVPVDENDMSSFDLMTEQIIAQLLKAALSGNLGAAKLFLEASKSWNYSKDIKRHNSQIAQGVYRG